MRRDHYGTVPWEPTLSHFTWLFLVDMWLKSWQGMDFEPFFHTNDEFWENEYHTAFFRMLHFMVHYKCQIPSDSFVKMGLASWACLPFSRRVVPVSSRCCARPSDTSQPPPLTAHRRCQPSHTEGFQEKRRPPARRQVPADVGGDRRRMLQACRRKRCCRTTTLRLDTSVMEGKWRGRLWKQPLTERKRAMTHRIGSLYWRTY